MTELEKVISSIGNSTIPILDSTIPLSHYTPIDLSVSNSEIRKFNISQPDICQNYIDKILESRSARIAYGGYLEKRNLYQAYGSFQQETEAPRNIHLGVDFWASAGTSVLTPVTGKVHSFKNNSERGDYGPTIVLKHHTFHRSFYTLYGHLALSSIKDLHLGKLFRTGEVLGKLGRTKINVNYAPHLHFQIIINIGDHLGDYPGVCNTHEIDFYKNNCPDPNLLLKL